MSAELLPSRPDGLIQGNLMVAEPGLDPLSIYPWGIERVADGDLLVADAAPSESALAYEFVRLHRNCFRYVAPWSQWLRWDGMRWTKDSTTVVFDLVRRMAHFISAGTDKERRIANSAFVAGTERLARHDQRLVVLPDQLDADPWALNTQLGIVDLRTGEVRPHDPSALMTRITTAAVNPDEGRELWADFLRGITQGDKVMEYYLQRVAGYCATGVTTEDVLVFLFGEGSNGKSSWVEAVADVLGDYAKMFSPEVLMESKSDRHPTELAQFRGVRMAYSSEPSSTAVWNDSRIKALTGDATINARVMRGDPFTFPRTHKTVLVGNHMPKLNAVSNAIRRRLQMVPFRAFFSGTGGGLRERLKAEAGGAILAWIVAGAVKWQKLGTHPPKAVLALTDDYLADQDELGQWFSERVERDPTASERSGDLHANYAKWCEQNGCHPKSNTELSKHLVALGLEKKHSGDGKRFLGVKLRV